MERGRFTFVNWRKKKESAVATTVSRRGCVIVLLIGTAVAASYCKIKVYTPRSRFHVSVDHAGLKAI